MKTEIDKLRRALKEGVNRGTRAETAAILEQMLEHGMLEFRHAPGSKARWIAKSATSMHDQIHGVESSFVLHTLELFIAGEIGFRTSRGLDGPGIYWCAIEKPN